MGPRFFGRGFRGLGNENLDSYLVKKTIVMLPSAPDLQDTDIHLTAFHLTMPPQDINAAVDAADYIGVRSDQCGTDQIGKGNGWHEGRIFFRLKFRPPLRPHLKVDQEKTAKVDRDTPSGADWGGPGAENIVGAVNVVGGWRCVRVSCCTGTGGVVFSKFATSRRGGVCGFGSVASARQRRIRRPREGDNLHGKNPTPCSTDSVKKLVAYLNQKTTSATGESIPNRLGSLLTEIMPPRVLYVPSPRAGRGTGCTIRTTDAAPQQTTSVATP